MPGALHALVDALANEDTDRPLLHARIVAVANAITAFAVAQVVFILTAVSTDGSPMVVDERPPFIGGLAVVAALALLAAPFLESWMLHRKPPTAGAGPPDVRARYAAAKTVGFGARELAALCGFVLALFTGQPWWSYGLSAAALLAMALAWPRASDLPRRPAGHDPAGIDPA